MYIFIIYIYIYIYMYIFIIYIYIFLGISLSCSLVIVSELFSGEVFKTFVILSTISLPIKLPVVSAV